jgi:chromosome segregation ATPase
MEKKLLPYLVIISALSVSLSAAFYSVTGLSKMFSGASIEVMIMMSSLEISKLVMASLLYQYWSKLNNALKTYYFIAIFILMSITSAGIYGYLSSAYSETSLKIENIDKNIKVLNLKREMFTSQLSDLNNNKKEINNNITNLTNALSNNILQTKDKSGQIITTTSSANRKSYEKQLEISQKNLSNLQIKEISLVDSISKIDLNKLELETNTEIAGEIGPLKYISKLTGKSIDIVINWFIIALMLVFDPLAISLVLGANVIFKDKRIEKEKYKKLIEIDDKIKEFEVREEEFIKSMKDFEEKEKNINLREKEFEDNFSKKLSEINEKEVEHKTKIEEIKNIEEKKLKIDQDIKLKEEKLKSEIEKEQEKIKNEKAEISKIKKEIDENSKEIESKMSELREFEKELLNKENILENNKEELIRLENEIKGWESLNWKMKRMKGGKPPSAI